MSRLSVKSVLCLLIGLLAQVGHAQLREFDITPVQSNRVPVFRDHPDMAAVIVNSSLPNLQFDSNLGIVAVLGDATQGEYILIVQPVRQIVTVRGQGFQQGRIPITLNQARQVAYFKVEPKDRIITETATLIVRTEPSGATVEIVGTPGEFTTPYTFPAILAMTHTLRIRLNEYQTEERLVRVEAGRANVESVTLIPTFGFLLIREPDLELYLKTAADPQEYRVSYTQGQPVKQPVGAYSYRFTKQFHRPAEDTLRVRPGLTTVVNPTFAPDYATYRFGAMPRGAVQVQAAPQRAPAPSRPNEINLHPGTHELTISAQGYAPERIRVVARSGLVRDTVVTLTGLGNLTVTSTIPGASVALSDGRTLPSPALFSGLRAGRYSAAISAPFHAPDSIRIDVQAFQENARSVSLRPLFSTLRVTSNAPAIQLSSTDNRAPQSTSPGVIYLEQGQREVLAQAAGYAPVRMFVRSVAGAVVDTSITLLSVAQARDLERREALPRGVLQLAADVDAEIYVNGTREGRMQTVLTLVPGTYDVEFRHPLKTERFSVNVPSADLVVRQVYLRPSKSTAMLTAAVLPGAGHIYTKQSRGYLYLGAVAGALGLAVVQNGLASDFTKEYDAYFAKYQSARTVAEAATYRQQLLQAREDANAAVRMTTYGLLAAAGIHVVQLIDLSLTRPKYGYRSTQGPFSASLGPGGWSLTYRLP